MNYPLLMFSQPQYCQRCKHCSLTRHRWNCFTFLRIFQYIFHLSFYDHSFINALCNTVVFVFLPRQQSLLCSCSPRTWKKGYGSLFVRLTSWFLLLPIYSHFFPTVHVQLFNQWFGLVFWLFIKFIKVYVTEIVTFCILITIVIVTIAK